MAEITSTSRHLSGMVRVFRHAGSGRGAIATAVDLSGRVPCVADVVGTRVAKIAFSSRSRGLFGSTSTVWALGLQLQLSPPHFGVESSCVLARVSAPSGVHRRAVLQCRSFVVARTVCTEFRDPEGRRRTVFRVCSRCTRLSANSCGLELVVRRECACAVLTMVTNAGGPRRAVAMSHVCSRKIAWCAHVLLMSMLSIGL